MGQNYPGKQDKEVCSVRMIMIAMVIFNLVSVALIGVGVYIATKDGEGTGDPVNVTWTVGEACKG